MERASELGDEGKSYATITYTGYESPPDLLRAGDGSYAENGSRDLSEFQEGLRATRDPELPPSNNTIVGHSYGTTAIGYATRDHRLDVDNIVLTGSPGVGVDHARELRVNPDNVWAGKGGAEEINGAISLDPNDWINPRNDLWFGTDPGDPAFDARDLPAGQLAQHDDYWDNQKSLDGMARVIAGKGA